MVETSQSGPIFLITGTPGAGKSSVSSALMRRFPFGLHMPVDDLREWVVSGISHPVPVWTSETTRQFRLARQSAASVARLYGEAGFAVAIDDVIFPAEASAVFEGALSGMALHKILLRPDLEGTLQRNRERTNKEFDTSALEGAIEQIYKGMSEATFRRAGWLIVDSSQLSIAETVDAIMSRV